ncbi:carbon starvation CstA family protein [Enterobacter chuandaensis]|uniref:carbon starvation CstA family protein n=1 Tax=Enterobacter chuandaensis TaxID=2497875 RepID=UPI0034D95A03
MRFLRPRRVGEVSVIGIVLLVASIYFGGVILTYWYALTFRTPPSPLRVVGYAFVSLPVANSGSARLHGGSLHENRRHRRAGDRLAIINPVCMPAVTQYHRRHRSAVERHLFPFVFITIACEVPCLASTRCRLRHHASPDG